MHDFGLGKSDKCCLPFITWLLSHSDAETAVPVRAGSWGHQKVLAGAPVHPQPYCTRCCSIKWSNSWI